MDNILKITSEASEERAADSVYLEISCKNVPLLVNLAQSFLDNDHTDEAFLLAEHALREEAGNTDALRIILKAFHIKKDAEGAIDRVSALRYSGGDLSGVIEDVRRLLSMAASVHNEYFRQNRFEEALNLSRKLLHAFPDVEMFRNTALQDEFSMLEQAAEACKQRSDHAAEARHRFAIMEHPNNEKLHSVLRLSNVHRALSCLLLSDFDDEKRMMARQLVESIAAIPPVPPDAMPRYQFTYDTIYRLAAGSIDVDAIFGPPVEPRFWPSMDFVSSRGMPLEPSAIRAAIEEHGVEAIFFTAGSEPFFTRYTPTYVSSILAACDCNCLIMICMAGDPDHLVDLVRGFALDDPRVVFCVHDFQPEPEAYRIYSHGADDPSFIPGPYYAAVGLMGLGNMLRQFGTPMFITGIDTVLQNGVREILERSKGSDVVLNKWNTVDMQGQIVNSLVLAYPTDNALLFAGFVRNYLVDMLSRSVQPCATDQLVLLLAMHHLLANGTDPKIGFFAEFDINNHMLTQENYKFYVELKRKFVFLNIFASGAGEIALRPDEALETVGQGSDDDGGDGDPVAKEGPALPQHPLNGP